MMTFQTDTAQDPMVDVKERVLEAALPNVTFDGWTDRVLAEAVEDANVEPALARMAFPRGGIDLALSFHHMMDRALARKMEETDLGELRYSDRVARAIEMRLELIAPHRDAVRRAAALLALPIYAPDGARAIWQTADTIWTGLGDSSEDVNWYTKRATLSGVYSACVLYWLGDESPDMEATRAFIDRRIADVMQFEKVKAGFRNSPLGRAFEAGPGRILSQIRKPGSPPDDLPGAG
jgi:ubiquinone biosynthesis protein COQ9